MFDHINCTLVSALIPDLNIKSKNIKEYLDFGKDLLLLKIPKIIFLPYELHDWARENSDPDLTRIISFNKKNIYEYFWNELNEEKQNLIKDNISHLINQKDNLDYFICINNKTNWLSLAKENNYFNTDYFMWIDFDIKHVIKEKINNILSIMKVDYFKKEGNIDTRIIIPSLIDNLEKISESDINLDKPDHWITIGSLILLHKNKIDFFCKGAKAILYDLLINKNLITWEVNIWSTLILRNKNEFISYQVNWDSSIIDNLLLLLSNQNFLNKEIISPEVLLNYLSQLRSNKKYNEAFLCYHNLKKEYKDFYIKNQDKIDYEMTILFYYVYNNEKIKGCKFLINFINNFDLYEKNVWDNLLFYIINLKNSEQSSYFYLKTIDLKSQNFNNSSSCRLITKSGKDITNIRYVNYIIPDYKHINGSTFNFSNPVITKNYLNGENLLIEKSNLKKYRNIIEGLEDIRLFEKDNKICFLATSKQYQENINLFRIVTGNINLNTYEIEVTKVFDSPDNQSCEKNWTILNENEIIYKWFPLSIYSYDNLNLLKKFDNLPKIFKYFRGSTSCIDIEGFKYCLVHSVHQQRNNTRKYLHWLVKLDQNGYPIAYSIPFDFECQQIEYCLSINFIENKLVFNYSINDCSTKSLEIPFIYFSDKWIEI